MKCSQIKGLLTVSLCGTVTLMMNLQVAVPPSSKALLWFCCQPESSEVFPVFFLSKEKVNATIKSLYLNDTRGVFGIGTAIPFASSSSTSSKQSSLKRFVSAFSFSCWL